MYRKIISKILFGVLVIGLPICTITHAEGLNTKKTANHTTHSSTDHKKCGSVLKKSSIIALVVTDKNFLKKNMEQMALLNLLLEK